MGAKHLFGVLREKGRFHIGFFYSVLLGLVNYYHLMIKQKSLNLFCFGLLYGSW